MSKIQYESKSQRVAYDSPFVFSFYQYVKDIRRGGKANHNGSSSSGLETGGFYQ